MRKTKLGFIELCAQVSLEKPGISLARINIEQTLNGEREFPSDSRCLKTKWMTAWVFGFISNNYDDDDLIRYFEYAYNHDWFLHDIEDEDYQWLIREFCTDMVLKDRYVYKAVADRIIEKYPNTKLASDLSKISYATGFTDLGFNKLVQMKNKS